MDECDVSIVSTPPSSCWGYIECRLSDIPFFTSAMSDFRLCMAYRFCHQINTMGTRNTKSRVFQNNKYKHRRYYFCVIGFHLFVNIGLKLVEVWINT